MRQGQRDNTATPFFHYGAITRVIWQQINIRPRCCTATVRTVLATTRWTIKYVRIELAKIIICPLLSDWAFPSAPFPLPRCRGVRNDGQNGIRISHFLIGIGYFVLCHN